MAPRSMPSPTQRRELLLAARRGLFASMTRQYGPMPPRPKKEDVLFVKGQLVELARRGVIGTSRPIVHPLRLGERPLPNSLADDFDVRGLARRIARLLHTHGPEAAREDVEKTIRAHLEKERLLRGGQKAIAASGKEALRVAAMGAVSGELQRIHGRLSIPEERDVGAVTRLLGRMVRAGVLEPGLPLDHPNRKESPRLTASAQGIASVLRQQGVEAAEKYTRDLIVGFRRARQTAADRARQGEE